MYNSKALDKIEGNLQRYLDQKKALDVSFQKQEITQEERDAKRLDLVEEALHQIRISLY